MLDFDFRNFNSTDDILHAVVALDNLAKELHFNGYDYSSKPEHVFEIEGMMVYILTYKGEVNHIKVIDLLNEEEGVVQ